jgi:glucose/mannose-6-phosphate isomerase
MDLDRQETYQTADPHRMREMLLAFPRQCQEGAALGRACNVGGLGRPTSVVVAGMGGSAIAGDLLKAYGDTLIRVPLVVARDYHLPRFVGAPTLVIVSSYSGNTEETLAAFEDASGRGARRLCLCSGGMLEEVARESGVEVIKLPSDYPPRCTVGFSFFALMTVLNRLGLASYRRDHVAECVETLHELVPVYDPATPAPENQAKQLAEAMLKRFPVIYAARLPLGPVAFRWQTQLNENSKTFCHHGILPEMDHNEIVGWENPRGVLDKAFILFLRHRSEGEKLARRAEITAALLREAGYEVGGAWGKGDGALAGMFSLLYLGDWVSYYLALLNGVDPTLVARIDRLKDALSSSA